MGYLTKIATQNNLFICLICILFVITMIVLYYYTQNYDIFNSVNRSQSSIEKFEMLKEGSVKEYALPGIDGILYINLDNRPDRKTELEAELKKIDVNFNKVQRISGVLTPGNGHYGCGQSHILALTLAKLKDWDNVLILEDDARIIDNPDEFKKKLETLTKPFINSDTNTDKNTNTNNNNKWDILLLAALNEKKDDTKLGADIKKIKDATTTGAYIINKNYIDKLIHCFSNANNMMMSNGLSDNKGDWEDWAIDQQWKKLQNVGNWYCLNNMLFKQADSWSSINNCINPNNNDPRCKKVPTN